MPDSYKSLYNPTNDFVVWAKIIGDKGYLNLPPYFVSMPPRYIFELRRKGGNLLPTLDNMVKFKDGIDKLRKIQRIKSELIKDISDIDISYIIDAVKHGKKITIYRAVPVEHVGGIAPGQYVTTSLRGVIESGIDYAKEHGGGKRTAIYSEAVYPDEIMITASHWGDDSANQNEWIYVPRNLDVAYSRLKESLKRKPLILDENDPKYLKILLGNTRYYYTVFDKQQMILINNWLFDNAKKYGYDYNKVANKIGFITAVKLHKHNDISEFIDYVNKERGRQVDENTAMVIDKWYEDAQKRKIAFYDKHIKSLGEKLKNNVNYKTDQNITIGVYHFGNLTKEELSSLDKWNTKHGKWHKTDHQKQKRTALNKAVKGKSLKSVRVSVK
jgi:hypothetical protein